MRSHERGNLDLRPIKFTKNFLENLSSSVLVEQGKTKVLCTAIYEEKLPPFLKGANKGWITAEYSMLPGSTGNQRISRERGKTNSRNIEIQRFISRALRTVINLETIKDFTITIDCDVIQADGGTRCASVNSGMLALKEALKDMVYETVIPYPPELTYISAISIGIKNNEILADLDYEEDSNIDADINIVSNEREEIVEIQLFGEKSAIKFSLFTKALEIGIKKNNEIIGILKSL